MQPTAAACLVIYKVQTERMCHLPNGHVKKEKKRKERRTREQNASAHYPGGLFPDRDCIGLFPIWNKNRTISLFNFLKTPLSLSKSAVLPLGWWKHPNQNLKMHRSFWQGWEYNNVSLGYVNKLFIITSTYTSRSECLTTLPATGHNRRGEPNIWQNICI